MAQQVYALNKTYPDTELSLSARQYRLLHLLPGTEDETIECTLHHADYGESSQIESYEALSYTWGRNTASNTIQLNGACFNVTDNLFHALSHLRLPHKTRVLWVDALCINQSNTTERNHQVQQMADIYSRASLVLVWLGLDKAKTGKRAFQFLQETALLGYRDRKELKSHPGWSDLVYLCDREYWKRVWIVQEICLASRITVVCGCEQISWEHISGLRKARMHSRNLSEEERAFMRSLPARIDLQRESRKTGGCVLWALLDTFKESLCTEIRDRIYGFLALSNDCGSEGIPIDYNKSVNEIYDDLMYFYFTKLSQRDASPSQGAQLVNLSELLQDLLQSHPQHTAVSPVDGTTQTRHPLVVKIPAYKIAVVQRFPSYMHSVPIASSFNTEGLVAVQSSTADGTCNEEIPPTPIMQQETTRPSLFIARLVDSPNSQYKRIVGIAPRGIRTGDIICTFVEARTAFVLRPSSGDVLVPGSRCTLVGNVAILSSLFLEWNSKSYLKANKALETVLVPQPDGQTQQTSWPITLSIDLPTLQLLTKTQSKPDYNPQWVPPRAGWEMLLQAASNFDERAWLRLLLEWSREEEYDIRDEIPYANNEKLRNDERGLRPEVGTETDFIVPNNPFAFSPGQLNKMFNPQNLVAFYMLGGIDGLEKGLRTNRKAGLSLDETHLDGQICFDEARARNFPADTNGSFFMATSTPFDAASSNVRFADRLRVFQDNRLPEKERTSLLWFLWATCNDKVLILLSIAAVVSLAVGLHRIPEHQSGEPKAEWAEAIAIFAAIAVIVIIGSITDYQKDHQFAKLSEKKQDRNVRVIRSGRTAEISVFDIMVGDVIHLEPGDLVPADGILIDGFDVRCDESQITGESEIVRKRHADEVYNAIENDESLEKMDPFIQSGARITGGVGTYMATSTGVYSSYGRIQMFLDEDTDMIPRMTPLQAKLNVIATRTSQVGLVAGVLLFLVLFIKFLVYLPRLPASVTPAEKGQNFIEIFITVVAMIVVAVPEGLPLAVTFASAFATTRLWKDATLVRHPKACEAMGNVTTICSGKTGTLTENKMQVLAGIIGTTHRFGSPRPSSWGRSDESVDMGLGSEISIGEFSSLLSAPVKDLFLKSIALNSTADEGEPEGGEDIFIGSNTEIALLRLARTHLGMGPVSQERDNATTLQIFPFDSKRKCMGVVVQLPGGGVRLYVKGASEILLAKCTQTLSDPFRDDSVAALAAGDANTITELIGVYASRSMRTISICYTDIANWLPKSAFLGRGDAEFDQLFHDMCFIGMVGIQDPLRNGVCESVKSCQKAGVVVRMITEDNKATAIAIARESSILTPDSVVMEGPDFRNLSRQAQEMVIPKLHVLARSSPEDKRMLVERLKDMGETVAMTGDGVNDAPTLKMADVGFSKGIKGTGMAKEASDIVLMDDDFAGIVRALKWGRATGDAVKRFLQFQLTVNITAVVLTFVTAVSSESETSALTASQLLWVKLIMDPLAALALATDPPRDDVLDRKPEPKGLSIISVTMWKMIIGQALYQLTILFLLYYGNLREILPLPDPNYILEPNQINTLVFNTFVWMQIFNQWNNRRLDNRFNIFEGLTKNWRFIAISTIIGAAQVLIIFFGSAAFHIADRPEDKATWVALWAIAVVLGFISIPVGIIIRIIPDQAILAVVPGFLRRAPSVPRVTISEEEMAMYVGDRFAVRDELGFLRRVKGGRLNSLKFAI